MTADHSIAIITPRYAADFERCKLLCESIDIHVSGVRDHYILVDSEDYLLFSGLAGKNRHVINERDILPDWLHVMRSGLGPNARKLWFSSKTWPMRGWHVQQLRRIAIASHIDHEALLYCDSDMFFVRSFDGRMLWRCDDLRLYRKPLGITVDMGEHAKWLEATGKMLGVEKPALPHDDYINNLVSWRRQTVMEMCEHIENITGREWISALGRNRTFSECLVYGCYVDKVQKANAGHWHGDFSLCRTYWNGEALDGKALGKFIENMDEGQFAVGIQSFTGTDSKLIRQFLEKAA